MFQRPTWDEMFMLHAIMSSVRSSCLKRRCGAVLVKDKRIIASGYNGAPPGIETCLSKKVCFYDGLAWKDSQNKIAPFEILREQYKGFCEVVHAEKNAFNQCSVHGISAVGSILYSTNFPCPRCVIDVIIPNKVSKVVVWKDYLRNIILSGDEFKISTAFLKEADIGIEKLDFPEQRVKEICEESLSSGNRLPYKFHPDQL